MSEPQMEVIIILINMASGSTSGRGYSLISNGPPTPTSTAAFPFMALSLHFEIMIAWLSHRLNRFIRAFFLG
jgi:hypothetical protein